MVKIMASHVSLFLCVIFLGATQALELRSVQEGSCFRNYNPTQQVDRAWLDRLRYFTGGSKYHLFRLARNHPRFRQMTESEFYYNACYTKNTSIVEDYGTIVGFGGIALRSYSVRESLVELDSGAILDLVVSPPDADTVRQRVILTDNKTYAVMANCWVNSNQRGWGVYSLVPELSRATERLIEDRVQALGFKRENNVFLRRGNCQSLDGGNRPWSSRPAGNQGEQGSQHPGGNRGDQWSSGNRAGQQRRGRSQEEQLSSGHEQDDDQDWSSKSQDGEGEEWSSGSHGGRNDQRSTRRSQGGNNARDAPRLRSVGNTGASLERGMDSTPSGLGWSSV